MLSYEPFRISNAPVDHLYDVIVVLDGMILPALRYIRDQPDCGPDDIRIDGTMIVTSLLVETLDQLISALDPTGMRSKSIISK
ncbi:hypothetical protein AAJCM20276_35850 (plasmid) [Acetobacter aceti]|uniref:Uncharacterized protein n=1 Tax=Acetobacter aceti TaxID=435 RepID=A0A6S6PQK0_ACEAC|nr:hypothetical protein [Acetobacter aceti]BCI68961.1 hypothetical protein AAJCM20276_35850 [Acetobacter aceti]